jgi:DNA-binding winged helix-turn-helix (wHTH) protein
MAIFKILIDLYIEEFYACTIIYISISKIDLLLRAQGFDLEDPEKQIRQNIYYIRNSIKKSGINLEIIESHKWKGYRINNHIFLKKF